jgi:DNA modification methylase
MTVEIIHGDARRLPLEDDSVDLVVTSPPYFNLRSYQDGGEHYEGQIGAEATPGEYIDALIECTREWMRVLKPEGNLWVNLGDKYAWEKRKGMEAPHGSLFGLPWRYAFRCMDELGLALRAEVIWHKTSALPESVTDRVRRNHEQWLHLVQDRQYFADVNQIREPHAASSVYHRDMARLNPGGHHDRRAKSPGQRPQSGMSAGLRELNAIGALPGSVWEVASQPLKVPAELGVSHFAAFPIELPRRIIQGWSPAGICTECGEGRRSEVDRTSVARHPSGVEFIGKGFKGSRGVKREIGNVRTVNYLIGYACACPEPTAPTRPAVVLDPFGGTGTTALAADVLGRHGISVDASKDYCRIARWRTTDAGERARAMRVQKPEPEMEGQMSLLDALESS